MERNEILARAEELGRMIQTTEIYAAFIRGREALKSDTVAFNSLEHYVSLSREMNERRDMGGTIESFELEDYRILEETVLSSEIIMLYLEAQQKYLDLLMTIQREISDPDSGDFPMDDPD